MAEATQDINQKNLPVSMQQAQWRFPDVSLEETDRIMKRYGVKEIIARLLLIRGIPEAEIESFLDPQIGRDFPNPFKLKDMQPFAVWLAEAIADGKTIGVLADFDVDGATSAAIMTRFLRYCGQDKTCLYVPDRLSEGYGPSEKGFAALKEQGAEIVLVLDCGITGHAPLEAAKGMGLEVAVLDHHEPAETLPPARFVIDPKRRDDESGYDMLAACGVTFLACVAVNASLREHGFFKQTQRAEVPLKNWLDLLALGTICDVVPLLGPNRLFARHGLARFPQTENAGLRALMTAGGMKPDEPASPYHMGFVLGPRINAGSRMGAVDLGARLLIEDDPAKAEQMAWQLHDYNDKRKAVQDQMLNEAERVISAQGEEIDNLPALFVALPDGHAGLSGLVAGLLKEQYGKPAIVVTYENGPEGPEGRGSGRSVAGVNLGAAFLKGVEEGYLLKGGGHAMAAGFTLDPSRQDEFRDFVLNHIAEQLSGQPAVSDMLCDDWLTVNGLSVQLVSDLQNRFGPFGASHEEPVWVLQKVCVHQADQVGKDHIRCLISDWEGGTRIKAMAFRALNTPLGEALMKGRGKLFHLVGHAKINRWQGRESVEFHILDAMLCR